MSMVGARLRLATAVCLVVLWPLTAVTAGAAAHAALGGIALTVTVAHVAVNWKALMRLPKASRRQSG
jgi:hypothetical protein